MLSLYIHIPFCSSKCSYCSFNSLPIEASDTLIDTYISALKQEIDHYAASLTDKSLKTLYIGGGTPSKIGVRRIIDIIEHIKSKFDLEDLAELSIELNPYPEEEVLNFVEILNKKYPKISRLRYSFGIQSFDDEVLTLTGRGYSFGTLVEFLRALVMHRKENNVFNFDFIAFGKFQVSKNGHTQLRHEFKRDFFQKFLASGYVDSISLYTLEGIRDPEDSRASEGKDTRDIHNISSSMFHVPCPTSQKWHGSDDEIMEEFTILKEMIEHEGFVRYEISNFAKAGKASIHNMVYRNMEPYIGLGLSASSFFGDKRWANTGDIKKYIAGHRVDEQQVQILNSSDLLIEEFFLRLRTTEGIPDLFKFIAVLVPHYQELLARYLKAGFILFDGSRLQLTDLGMNVYNSIITDFLQKL